MTVEALRRGRPEVLADLLARYGKDMQAVAYLIVRDHSTAEAPIAPGAVVNDGQRGRDPSDRAF